MAEPLADGPWDPEPIPLDDLLSMRVARTRIAVDGDGVLVPEPDVFTNHGAGMSTDWRRYSTPHQTRRRSLQHPPSSYGVISLRVSDVLAIDGQRVEHTPIFNTPEDRANPNNRAHTDVVGPKSRAECGDRLRSTMIRNRFVGIARWAVLPDAPVEDD